MTGAAFVSVMAGRATAINTVGMVPAHGELEPREAFGWEFFSMFVVGMVYFRHVNWHYTSPAGQFATEAGLWTYGMAITVASLMAVRFSG